MSLFFPRLNSVSCKENVIVFLDIAIIGGLERGVRVRQLGYRVCFKKRKVGREFLFRPR